jgi:spermidine/putrescine transport system permease protein
MRLLVLACAAAAALGLLYLPLAAVAALSVNASRWGTSWSHVTLAWYAQLGQDDAMLAAAWHSLVLALVSAAIATALGTALAIGLWRSRLPRWLARLADVLVLLPVVTPDVLFAACLVVAAALWNSLVAGADGALALWPGWLEMIAGHACFELAFVAMVVSSALAGIPREQEEAARDLYADDWCFWRRVLLPQLMPAIAAGAVLAVLLSLDDFMVSFFTSSPATATLPLRIYASARRGLAPDIDALSTALVAASAVLVIMLCALLRPRRT